MAGQRCELAVGIMRAGLPGSDRANPVSQVPRQRQQAVDKRVPGLPSVPSNHGPTAQEI
jgi:hypothetical protein